MTNVMNNLFAAESNNTTVGNRGLSGTAQLTQTASNIATEIIRVMNDDIDTYVYDIRKSQSDNNAMDALIEKVHPLVDTDVSFLEMLDDKTLDGMLKSQQSKRSRCKSKAMTMDNYRALMTGAIAENLIRMVTGKQKNAVGARRMSGSVEYTIEQLQDFANDQDKLRKEIRNVQSKKSIMKSKADFDENSERYQQLLRVEQQLKDMRTTTTEIVEVDRTADALSELIAGKDFEHMKAADAKALLAQIASLVTFDGIEEPEETEQEEVTE